MIQFSQPIFEGNKKQTNKQKNAYNISQEHTDIQQKQIFKRPHIVGSRGDANSKILAGHRGSFK